MTSGVISIINEKIKQALDCKVQGGAVYGIAEQTIRQTDGTQQVFPTVYDNDGHGKDVTVDDTYPFIVYHRLLNKSYSYPQLKSFGNPKEYIQEAAEYVCVVYAKRAYLKMTAEQVETLVKVSIPATLTNQQLQQLQIKSAVIQHNSSVLDTQTNFNAEYKGIENKLGSEEILITLRYTIETVISKDCLKVVCEETQQPPTIQLFASATNVNIGDEIEIGWIATNVNKVFIDGIGWLNGAFGFITITINATTAFVGTATNSAGTATDTIQITVGSGCADATAVLKDTDGNIISTTNIPSGDSDDVVAPNGTVTAVNSNNSFSQSQTTLSGGVANLNLPDITVTDSDGSTYQQASVTDVVCTPATPLVVDFSVDDTTPVTNQTINFTDLTVGASSWLWDFGDGILSTLQNPTHSYKTTGTFTVTLCASSGSNSGKEVKTNYITVSLEAEVTTDLIASYNSGDWIDASGVASQWNDSSGNGFDAIENTLINRPLIVTNDLNGLDTLQFDGVNDKVLNTDVTFTTTTSTVYMVFRRGRIHTANEALSSGANVAAPNARLIYNTSNEVSYFPRNQTITRGVSYGNNVNQWLIMAVVFDGANSSVKFMQSAPAPVGNIGSTATFGIVIGAAIGGASFQGKIAEKKVYDVAHNAATQAQVIQRLQAKFNLYD